MNNDLISREALKKALKSNCDTLCPDKNTNWCEHCCPLNDFEDLIDNAPTVCGNNPKWCESCVSKGKCASTRPQGEWKPKPVTFGTCFLQGFECECGRIVMQRENFCPDCGAQMVGGGENE